MDIIGFNFKKIFLERLKPLEGQLKIDSNIKIEEIKEQKIEFLNNEKALEFSFLFTIVYNPNKMAEIEFKGNIAATLNKKEIKEVMEKWKDKRVSDTVRTQLYNFILNKCNLKALQLEQDLNLPLHLPLPRVSDEPKNLSEKDADRNREYVR